MRGGRCRWRPAGTRIRSVCAALGACAQAPHERMGSRRHARRRQTLGSGHVRPRVELCACARALVGLEHGGRVERRYCGTPKRSILRPLSGRTKTHLEHKSESALVVTWWQPVSTSVCSCARRATAAMPESLTLCAPPNPLATHHRTQHAGGANWAPSRRRGLARWRRLRGGGSRTFNIRSS